jgi:lactate permease
MPATLISAFPLVTVILLIASRRVGLLAAGAIGWGLAIAAAALLSADLGTLPAFAALETLKGAWIAWQAIAVILAGLFFYRAVRDQEARLFESTGSAAPFSHRQLYTVCFLLGPFAESATGFGVGCIIAAAALLRLGLGGVPAVVLSLFSQMLVPWGALAVGTLVGAGLSGESETALSFASAVLTMPLLLFYLLLYWRAAAAAGHPVPIAQRADDALWTALLALALTVLSRFLAAELVCLTAAGGLLVLRYFRDRRPDWPALRRTLGQAGPYAVLSLVLIATRVVPPLTQALQSVLVFKPFPGLPAFGALYNPSFWLIVVALGFTLGAGRARRLGALVAEAVRGGWRPAAVTLLFVAMAQILVAAGAAGLIGTALHQAFGPATLLATPLLGAVGGFLTGSNAASNGMMMPVQIAMTTGLCTAETSFWAAAIQNTTGSNFTLLSPIRVAMALALVAPGLSEGTVYRAAWPIAAMLALTLLAEAGVVLAVF